MAELAKAPQPPKSPERDDWDRALSSLESEFDLKMGSPDAQGPPASGATSIETSALSSAKALVATQDLRLEVDRLREELELRERALDMFRQLKDEGELGDIVGQPTEDPAARAKLQKLESSLAAAEETAASRHAAAEALRAQLAAAQDQLRLALGALASRMPMSAEALKDGDGVLPDGLKAALTAAAADPLHAGAKEAGPRVIRRHAPPMAGAHAEHAMVAPVEAFGPDRTSIGFARFALGEGEALELLLSTLYNHWRGLGKSFETRVAPDGIHIVVADDPENRKVSILTSGSYVLHVGAAEADRVRTFLNPPAGPGGGA